MALITKGLTLSYKSGSASSYTALTNLLEIPELGGSKDSIEVTTLADSAHVYIDGLENYGDSLDFKFVYDSTQFETLRGLTGTIQWQVGIPDGASGVVDTTVSFSGSCSVKIEGKGVGDYISYILSIKPSTAMSFS